MSEIDWEEQEGYAIDAARYAKIWASAFEVGGFTREEAIRLVCFHAIRPIPNVIPPEMSELLARMSRHLEEEL